MMTTKRKVRADFDKSQPITVNVCGYSEDTKKQVIQAFFDVGLYWNTGDRSLTPSGPHVNSYTNFPDREPGTTNVRSYIIWSIHPSGITPTEFFAMVYEDEPQGHPHAELMMQYAEDAKTHAEPWKVWQLKNKKQPEWFDCTSNPYWRSESEYRRKPKTHLVHGVEVPDLRIKPALDERYYYPFPAGFDLVEQTMFSPAFVSDTHRLRNNLCYEYTEAGKQAAILHSKAWLGIA